MSAVLQESQNERIDYQIKKHSSIVQMSNITTMQERKTMNALIRIAKDVLKREPDQNSFTIDIGIIRRLAGIKSSDNELLKSALRKLESNSIEYNVLNKDKKEWGVFSFLARANIVELGRWNTTTVGFEFPSTILEVIKHPSMYVKLDLLVIRGLESKHSIALYEVMKDYQKLGEYSCSIDTFRNLMWIETGQYKIFTMFRKRVLDTAIDEINSKTDIHLEYDLVKEWRKIVAIKISVTRNTSIKTKGSELEKEVFSKLNTYWISELQINKILKTHDHHYLLANIRIVEESISRGVVKNPLAYLLKAIQTDFRKNKIDSGKRPPKKEKEIQKDNSRILQVDRYLESTDEQKLLELQNSFKTYLEQKPLFSKLMETKGFKHKVVTGQWKKFLFEKIKWTKNIE